MYTLSEAQITFIHDDLRRRGLVTEDLQLNLLDHICCIVENEFEVSGDFEHFYSETVRRFYRHELLELEEETQNLLLFKHYYAMKKTMIASGAIGSVMLSIGIILKFLHQPGAALMIVSGILLISFLFLPLYFIMKVKEKKETRDKLLTGFGAIPAILLSLGVLFKIMYWPGANLMGMIAILSLLFIYLPVYFINGYRNPLTKTNTIVTSIIILTGCGLFLTLVRSSYGTKAMNVRNTRNYLFNEQLLDNEQLQVVADVQSGVKGEKLYGLCEQLKQWIIRVETGGGEVSRDFELNGKWLGDSRMDLVISNDPEASVLMQKIRSEVAAYNAALQDKNGKYLPVNSFLLDSREFRTVEALNGLVQIQLCLLQNTRSEKTAIAEK